MFNPVDIKALIDADRQSDRKQRAMVGQRYYEGKHDILHYRMFYFNNDGKLIEDTTRSNMKIPHPFFTELADQLAAYMLSFEESPIQAKDTAEGLQEHLDAYFDDDFWSEIGDLIIGAYTKGFDYLYGYKNEEGRLAFQYADGMGVVEVREKDTDAGCAAVIYWYVDRVDKGKKEIIRIQVHTANEIAFYVQHGTDGAVVLDDSQPVNPLPNVVYVDAEGKRYAGQGLGFIPFWRLQYNRRGTSGLEPIKPIIDDYDLMKCGLSNNLQDFDHPIYAVRGFDGHDFDELQTNLRTKKIVGTGDAGGLDVVTVQIPVEARKANLEEDEKNIYKFGMGFNSAQVGDGNITNVVIHSRYTLLDLKAGKVEKPLNKMLRSIVRVVLDEINAAEGTDYQESDVKIKFRPEIPTNEAENVQNDYIRAQTKQLEVTTLLNAAAQIGDEAVLKALCDLFELDPDEIKAQLDEAAQETPEAAQSLLDQVVVEDEQEAEASAAGAAE